VEILENGKPGFYGERVRGRETAPLVIDTRGLSKSYKGVEALKPLDLKVPKHSIFGFLGPNGSGKSTTIKLLLGLAKPTGGSGTVFGRDIVEESIEIRQRVGYLAQDPRYYDKMTARQTLLFAAGFFYSGPKAAIEERVVETLELVGLTDKADRPIKGFSGGERQRLGIAQAQINHPDLLILDEPAAALAPMGRRDVLAVMERLREHTTIFYSTHLLEDVQRVSDSVAILKDGELIAQAPIEELLAGTGAVVYTLTLKGDAEDALQGDEPAVGVFGGRSLQERNDDVAGERDRRGHRGRTFAGAGDVRGRRERRGLRAQEAEPRRGVRGHDRRRQER
jgi:ABC-2 type transport system ATP-binding protein